MPASRRTVREGERFKCPYPGCKRSFAELWRLKVHYRAPPDVRGSGKERGHGQELAQCPQCGAKLLPGKHHIQCSGSRPKRDRQEAAKDTNTAPAATSAKRFQPVNGANGLSADALNGVMMHPSKAHSMDPTQWVPNSAAATHPSPSSSQLMPSHSYVRCFPGDTPGDKSWPPHGMIIAPQQLALQHPQQAQMQQAGHHAPSAPHIVHQPPPSTVAFTNTLVREAVPGNPNAAHCSLQTDLCGAVWPLHAPFPIAAGHMYPHHAHAYTVVTHPHSWDRSIPVNGTSPMPGAHTPDMSAPAATAAASRPHMSVPAAAPADSNTATHSRSQISSQTAAALGGIHMPHVSMPQHVDGLTPQVAAVDTSTSQVQVKQQPVNDVLQQQAQRQHHSAPSAMHSMHAAGFAAATGGLHQVKVEMNAPGEGSAHALGGLSGGLGFVPSPPSSPPPDVVDMLFDFDKFDALEGMSAGNGFGGGMDGGAGGPVGMSMDSALADMENIMDLPPITDNADLLKIFTQDSQGFPTMTSHLHQRNSPETSDHQFGFAETSPPGNSSGGTGVGSLDVGELDDGRGVSGGSLSELRVTAPEAAFDSHTSHTHLSMQMGVASPSKA